VCKLPLVTKSTALPSQARRVSVRTVQAELYATRE
jgi:hypothetical protein